jgi:hypothetical protein
MKKWGLVVTLLYALIVFLLLAPATLLLTASSSPTLSDFKEFYQHWAMWTVSAIFVVAQFALLFLSADTTQKRMRSRTPLAVSAITAAFFLAIVTFVVVFASYVVVRGENNLPDTNTITPVVASFVIPWMVWAVLFYGMYRNSTDPVTRLLTWLFRGSILELLVAVPSHVIVRRRHDCCAPLVTGFGITSGVAIMLISFGPSVLLLFKKRMEGYGASVVAK